MHVANLTIGFSLKGSKKVLLEDLNLQIPASKFIALIGKNGCGKSTLIKTLCGYLSPLKGEVYLNKISLSKLNYNERARQMAVVLTENIETPEITVYELVSLGRYPYSHWMGKLSIQDNEIISESIEKLGLSGFEERKFISLSDGEAQRALIARALCQKSKLIILDEPTSHLDIQNRFHIIQLLKEIAHNEGVSILYSTHEIDMALQTADLFWLIDDDKKLIEGSPEDLVLNGSLESAFNFENIRFNANLGHFEPVFSTSKSVRMLCANPLNQKWMSNALARRGFEIMPLSNGPVILYDEATKIWSLEHQHLINQHHTIESLINNLEAITEN